MKFTDKFIANLKPAPVRRVFFEENAHGQGSLGIRLSTVGRKTWVYMFWIGPKQRMLTLGAYPDMTVAQARQAFGEAMALRERGVDPSAKAVGERRELREAPTVKELAQEYLELYAKPRKKSAGRDEAILNRDVLPDWGAHKAEAITKRDVVRLLDKFVARGAPISANRTLACVRKMYNWAEGRDIVKVNPCRHVGAPSSENQRERALSDAELKTLLSKLPGAAMHEPTRLALMLLLLTAQRPGEAATAEWSEFDLDAGWWVIPPEKAKNGRAHRVPISAQARAVLDKARELHDGSFVFPSARGDRAMVETALSRAVHRNVEHFGIAVFTPHDLRRTAASCMTGMGVPRLVVQKLLNHVERGVTAVYDRHSYDAEKREALEKWGARVDLLSQQTSASVLP